MKLNTWRSFYITSSRQKLHSHSLLTLLNLNSILECQLLEKITLKALFRIKFDDKKRINQKMNSKNIFLGSIEQFFKK